MSKELIVKEPDEKQLNILQKTSSQLLRAAQSIAINSAPKLEEAQLILKRARDGQKFIKSDLKQFLDPIKFLKERIEAKYEATGDQLKETDLVIGRKIMDYKTSITVAVEEKKKDIVAQVETGKVSFEVASKKIEKQEIKIDQFKTRKIPDIEITDKGQIPLEFWEVNTVLLRKAVITEGREIPGVRKIIREIPIT